MIKTLSKAQKMEREKFRIPRSVQDAIPIRRIFADGIFQVGNQYSKTWSFTDINYAIASKEDKTSMFLDYSELLNALDSGASAKITIYNRRINKAEFEKSVLLPDKADGLDEYRHEFNKMLTAQVTGTSNSIVRERYLTVSVVKRNPDEARSYFSRVGTDLVTHLAQLSSVASELTLNERLHIFRDFFKAGEQAAAEFNIHEHAKRAQHFKDWLCPDSMEFAADHFKIDARFGRVLYLQDYASYIKDSFVSELCDLDRDLMLYRPGGNTKLQRCNLKHVYIVRYADDFKVFCRNYNAAKRLKIAVERWLLERLHLETSPEKSKITNLEESYSEFLGVKFKLIPKGQKWAIKSHMTDKAIKNQQKALKSLMVQACHDYGNPSVQHIFVNRYNQAVVGIHEYYSMATMVNEDMHRMFISIDKTMKCRCAGKNSLVREKPTKIKGGTDAYIFRKYGKSKQVRYKAL